MKKEDYFEAAIVSLLFSCLALYLVNIRPGAGISATLSPFFDGSIVNGIFLLFGAFWGLVFLYLLVHGVFSFILELLSNFINIDLSKLRTVSGIPVVDISFFAVYFIIIASRSLGILK